LAAVCASDSVKGDSATAKGVDNSLPADAAVG